MSEQFAQRRAAAEPYLSLQYPEALTFERKEGMGDVRGYKWLAMVNPAEQQANEIDAWMRANTGGRYFAGIWRPGQQPSLSKRSYRYWRLVEEQWKNLIDHCKADATLYLVVHFMGPTDYRAFDRSWGPGRILRD